MELHGHSRRPFSVIIPLVGGIVLLRTRGLKTSHDEVDASKTLLAFLLIATRNVERILLQRLAAVGAHGDQEL